MSLPNASFAATGAIVPTSISVGQPMMNSLDSAQSAIVDKLLRTGKLHAFNEIAEASKEVAKKRGIYSWWFKETPPGVPDERTIMRENKQLLYVGKGGDLKRRMNNHLALRCSSSTLRYSLAATLADSLDIQSTYRLSGKKKTKKILLLDNGEQKLTNWMEDNAFVIWVACNDPGPIETYLVKNSTVGEPRLPLNIQHSEDGFRTKLKGLRADLKCSS